MYVHQLLSIRYAVRRLAQFLSSMSWASLWLPSVLQLKNEMKKKSGDGMEHKMKVPTHRGSGKVMEGLQEQLLQTNLFSLGGTNPAGCLAEGKTTNTK